MCFIYCYLVFMITNNISMEIYHKFAHNKLNVLFCQLKVSESLCSNMLLMLLIHTKFIPCNVLYMDGVINIFVDR